MPIGTDHYNETQSLIAQGKAKQNELVNNLTKNSTSSTTNTSTTKNNGYSSFVPTHTRGCW